MSKPSLARPNGLFRCLSRASVLSSIKWFSLGARKRPRSAAMRSRSEGCVGFPNCSNRRAGWQRTQIRKRFCRLSEPHRVLMSRTPLLLTRGATVGQVSSTWSSIRMDQRGHAEPPSDRAKVGLEPSTTIQWFDGPNRRHAPTIFVRAQFQRTAE